MLVSSQEIEAASAKQYQQVIAEAAAKGALNRDARQVRRVRAIASRLTPQTGVFRPDALRWNWEVNVLESNELNAWCMAGGKIAFYSGLIERLSLSDDEIAAVMGHEIAHALREHARSVSLVRWRPGSGVSIASAVLGVGQVGNDLMGQVAKVTFELPNSRLHETEADRIGVELAARAGYDPRAAVGLWKRWRACPVASRRSGCHPPLARHPAAGSRPVCGKGDAALPGSAQPSLIARRAAAAILPLRAVK